MSLESYCNPAAFGRQHPAVPQPGYDPAKPHIPYLVDVYQHILATADDVVWKMASQPDPPVRLD